MPRTTSVFAILCACDCTERFQTWKVIFEFAYYYEEGLGAAASEIHFIQVPGIQVCMSVLLLCFYYGVRKNTDCLNQICDDWVFEDFSNNGLNFSFNSLFTSNIL